MDGTGDTDRWAVSVSRHPPPRILTINTGSSSLKTALYDENLKLKARGTVERIGLPGGRLAVADAAGRTLAEERGGFADHGAALHALLPRLLGPERAGIPAAIGHRIVHGGRDYAERRPSSPTTCLPRCGGWCRSTPSTCPRRSARSRRP